MKGRLPSRTPVWRAMGLTFLLSSLVLTGCLEPYPFNPGNPGADYDGDQAVTHTATVLHGSAPSKSHVALAGDALILNRENGGYAPMGELIAPPQRLSRQSNAFMMGLIAETPAHTTVRLYHRLSRDGLTWSQWRLTGPEEDIIIDVQGLYYRYFQYKAVLTTSDSGVTPRLRLVSYLHDAINLDLLGGRRKRRGGHDKSGRYPRPAVRSRSAWGARSPSGGYATHQPYRITLHHTWKPRATPVSDATLRGIQNYHMDHNGWSDVGYHYFIDRNGVIYAGRPESAVGAHCIPNTGNVGVCLIGDFDSGRDLLTAQAYDSLIKLGAYLCDAHGIDPTPATGATIFGHHDFASYKTCPGTTVYARLPEIRKDIENALSGGAAGADGGVNGNDGGAGTAVDGGAAGNDGGASLVADGGTVGNDGGSGLQDGGTGPGDDGGVPADGCRLHLTCAECNRTPGCGWCNDTMSCRPGSAAGPAEGACADWVVAASGCDPCGAYKKCSDCLKVYPCGWCHTLASCITGSLNGRDSGTCENWDWFSHQCDPCGEHDSCGACTAQAYCGWCDGACRHGSVNGPEEGSCGSWTWIFDDCGL